MKNSIVIFSISAIVFSCCMLSSVRLNAQCKPCDITPDLKLGTTVLEFKHTGQLVSNPPELLHAKDFLSARVSVDQSLWDSRRSTYISSYITSIINIQLIRRELASARLEVNFGLTSNDLIAVETEFAYEVYKYIRESDLDDAHKNFYKAKTALLGYQEQTTPLSTNYVPSLSDLIKPEFTITYRFYNKQGNRIDKESKLSCADGDCIDMLVPCQKKCDSSSTNASAFFISSRVPIPEEAHQVQYELRLLNSKSKVTVDSQQPFPNGLQGLLDRIKLIFNSAFDIQYAAIQDAADKLTKNPNDRTVSAVQGSSLAARLIGDFEPILTDINTRDQLTINWLLQNLWLTNGKLQINPFSNPSSSTSAKVTPEEKAKYELFELMLNKSAFQIDNIEQFETRFDQIPKIKAKMAAEASVTTSEQLADELLYLGMLMTSPSGTDTVRMRHHDALTDYIIMNARPIKEINEQQRLYVLVENKSPSLKLGVNLTTTPLQDEGTLIQSIATLADLAPLASDQGNPPANDSTNIAQFLARARFLERIVKAFRDINVKPDGPIIFEKDGAPKYVTDLLEHNFLFDAPVLVDYTIKSIAADNTEKEIKKGSYRINKLYRLRFKAGVVYSALEKRDFTFSGANTFTVANPRYGIDGTFGLQFYIKKQDIRNMKSQVFIYGGLSMKAIRENFYFGAGYEPVSGVALAAICHIGKREALTGVSGIPTGTKEVAGIGIGAAILIDANLFVKLFTWGNSNKAILGF